MRIEKLTLKNFRGFEELEIDFPKGEGGLAVFIGVNGSGKSSVLDALFYHLVQIPDMLQSNFIGIGTNLIFKGNYDEDIREKSTIAKSQLILNDEYLYECQFKLEKNNPSVTSYNFLKKENQLNKSNTKFDRLFVIAFYQTDRIISKVPSLKAKDLNKLSLKETFQLSTQEIIDFDYFFEWFRNTEDYENEQRLYLDAEYRHPGLEIIRKILTIFLKGYSNPRVRRQPSEKLVLEKGENILSVTQLSHGEKLIFAIIGDIIRRITISQPSLENPLLGKGVILIDEIEQHLHPFWQRTIIPNLRKTFPNIQFIITTHSPQVLSNVPRENVFILEDFKLRKYTPHTLGRDSNSILFDLFREDERPSDYKKKISELYNYIDANDREKAEHNLKKLKKDYGDDDREIVRAESYIELMDD